MVWADFLGFSLEQVVAIIILVIIVIVVIGFLRSR